ncbi:phosphoribosylformylglycinamidine cyclo-ligase [Desulfurella sp.]|uniref:phosphoribosylformylglycinamidine cyclo-ligase n=1 Tax=Desulfurella sp. TaxID=1962857 RepID=UPI003D0C3B7C
MNYKDSGVDIDKGNKFVESIKRLSKNLPDQGFVSKIGAFSSLFSLSHFGSDIYIASTTDGVGTKLKIAFAVNKHDSVGIDLVAMNVNDIITTGIMPAFFLDYIAYSDLSNNVLENVFKGIAEGLRQANCAIAGGETAQMPSMYNKGEYDLAGFCVGIGKKDDLFEGNVKEGDCLIGIASSGFHSNGYSLIRKAFFEIAKYKLDTIVSNKTLGEILLTPTIIYVTSVKPIKQYIKAAAHITGGGFIENIPRCLEGLGCEIDTKTIKTQEEFLLVSDIAKLSKEEMYRTFNMGVGFVLVVDEKDRDIVLDKLHSNNINSYLIGNVVKEVGVCLK